MTGTIIRVSEDATGTPGNRGSFDPVYSPDGTKVLFSSAADNLVPGDTNGAVDIFVKDLITGQVMLVSRNSSGVPGNADSLKPVFSPDGTKVMFSSTSSNFVAGDGSGTPDLFIKDLATGAITSVVTGSTISDAVFSPDGTRVAFVSGAANLVPGDTNGGDDVFVKNLATGVITRVSTNAAGGQANNSFFNGGSKAPVFSPDGSKIAFYSAASDLIAGDNNNTFDVFVKDLNTGAITRVSTDAAGAEAQQTGGATFNPIADHKPAFSPDGTKIAFYSPAPNLVPGDTNGTFDIFVKDLMTGAITRVSTSATGAQGNGGSTTVVFSPDGQKIAFVSEASNLVPGDTNGVADVFVKDLVTGEIVRLSADAAGGEGNDSSYVAGSDISFSPDGTHILFTSRASNLVPGDTNDGTDIFIKSVPIEPHAENDAYATGYDAPLTVDAAHGVLANDSDANGDPLTAELVTAPAHGTVVLNADGSFTYTPSGTYVGQDPFTYRAFDGSGFSREATATLTINGNMTRVSTTAFGTEVSAPLSFASATPQFLPDGKVAFVSGAVGLVPNDGNGAFYDIFIKDTVTGAISLVSRSSGGVQGNSHSDTPAFSADGTRMVFYSDADNLVAGDTNQTSDIFVKNLTTGAVTRVSTGADGGQADAASFVRPAISADGTKVAFASFAANLVEGDTGFADIFVKDLLTGAITRITADGQGETRNPVFSADGGKLAFESSASNLVGDDTNGGSDIFVKDLVTGAMTRVSTSASGTQANGWSTSAAFSPDGSRVAFFSNASNLVPGDTNNGVDLFVKDLITGAIMRASTNASGGQALSIGSPSGTPMFSPDGTKIVFAFQSINLVEGDTNGSTEIYVKDLVTGAIRRVSTDSFEAQENGFSDLPAFSPDGTKVAFLSASSNLVPGDTNNSRDIFVKDLTMFPIGTPSVTINQATAQADPVSAGPIVFDVIFSEPVTGFEASDISFAGSTAGGALVAAVQGGGATYTVSVTGMSGSGTVVASIVAGAATDADGNASLGSTSTDNAVAYLVPASWIGPVGGDWSDPANWSTGAAPGSDDAVVIDQGTVVITGDAGTVRSITVSGSAALTITGGMVTVSGDVVNGGAITVQGGTLTVEGGLGGTGTFVLDGDATVTIGGPVGIGETITLIDGLLKLSRPEDFQGLLTGIDDGDRIDLANVRYDPGDEVHLLSGNVLQIIDAGGAITLRLASVDADGNVTLPLDPNADYSGLVFHLADNGGGGTLITVDDAPCYCAGTRIATPSGEQPVEELAIGDLVLTAAGGIRPVLWIGRQTVMTVFADPRRHYPICISKGALDENVPARNLCVSPDHALLVDGVLVQAGALVNGTSIVQVTKPKGAFVYYHIELEDHALVLAEGAPAETFVDNVTRRRFDNYAEYEALFGRSSAHIPELALPRAKSARQLPRTTRGRLAARAAGLGFAAAA